MLAGDRQSSLADGGEQQGGDNAVNGGTPIQAGGTAGSRNLAGAAGAAGNGGAAGTSSGGKGGGNGDAGQGGSGGNSPSGGSAGGGGTAGAGGGATVELAQGMVTTASSEQSGNTSASANDGVSTTRWAASSSALPQWWRVDLGSICTVQSYTLTFQWSDREYSYTLETSTDGSVFANPQSKSGTGPQSGTFPATQARYVRVTVTATNPASFASLSEVSIKGY